MVLLLSSSIHLVRVMHPEAAVPEGRVRSCIFTQRTCPICICYVVLVQGRSCAV